MIVRVLHALAAAAILCGGAALAASAIELLFGSRYRTEVRRRDSRRWIPWCDYPRRSAARRAGWWMTRPGQPYDRYRVRRVRT